MLRVCVRCCKCSLEWCTGKGGNWDKVEKKEREYASNDNIPFPEDVEHSLPSSLCEGLEGWGGVVWSALL